ncbi:MAG: hypothetical protein FWC60_10860 [Firmicutes bacterium]|nr:hypothetical protein [Bacillota bacterium]
MTEKKEKVFSQPVRIIMATALWAALLWFLSFGHPTMAPITKAIFIVFVVPTSLVEWYKYRGLIREEKASAIKVAGMIVFALIWYFFLQ